MNNHSLVNLKQRNPLTGESLISLGMRIDPNLLRPLGWHTYCRINVALMVLQVKATEANGQPARDKIAGIRSWLAQRHQSPKGWKK